MPTPFTVMAEKHPPSPFREDDSFSLRGLRVKPAMTVNGGLLYFAVLRPFFRCKSITLS
jgi:hypothetical protein